MESTSTSTPETSTSTSETSNVAIFVTNGISIAACSIVLVAYFILRHKHTRLMQRTSLVLSASMAATDLVLSCANLAGFKDLPLGFTCQFVGGWLYAFPTLLSVFYASAIALNSQLVFVFGKRPGPSKTIYYALVPIAISMIICFSTLAAGVYGYDESWGYCWFATEGLSQKTIILRMFFAFDIWCFICVFYLVIAAVTIIRAVFSKHSRITQFTSSVDGSGGTMRSETVSRRNAAVKALTVRLIGYIVIPIFCVIPGVILDFVGKTGTESSTAVNGFFDGLNGLVGFFNAVLFAVDPAILAVYHDMKAARNRPQNGDVLPLDIRSTASAPDSAYEKGDEKSAISSPSVPAFTSGPKSSRSAGAPRNNGIVVRVQVEVTRVTDIHRVEDYLGGL